MFQHVLLQVLLPRSLKAARLAAEALVPSVDAHVFLQVRGGFRLVVVTELTSKAFPAVPTALVNPHHLLALEFECAHLQTQGGIIATLDTSTIHQCTRWHHYNAGHVNHTTMHRAASL